ncbi:MAG: hypothetical protein C0476_09755 [Sphingomonas sp.]|nr:hypothetical protein [Sphingomonas sp.]
MIAVLGAPESIAFVAALILMVLVGVVQLIGIGGDVDADAPAAASVDLLSWLGFGRVPVMVLLIVFLGSFGSTGLLIEQLAHDMFGTLLSPLFAVPGALAASVPLTALGARILAKLLPRDETSAVSLDSLIGEYARVTTGRAAAGSPARARVEDRHGQPHFVMVEPNSHDQVFEEGEAILLVRREDNLFRAISRGDHRLPHIGV